MVSIRLRLSYLMCRVLTCLISRGALLARLGPAYRLMGSLGAPLTRRAVVPGRAACPRVAAVSSTSSAPSHPSREQQPAFI